MPQLKVQPRFDSLPEFDDWAAGQDGRWELHDGQPVAMAPERVDHARIKTRTWQALDRALREIDRGCEAMLDGPLVPGPGLRRFQPDVLVVCGDRVDGDDLIVETPVLIVEVVSPSSEGYDLGIKLESYFALPSVRHYLVIFADRRLVVHHTRHEGPGLMTSLHREGEVVLDSLGITLPLDSIYLGSNLEGVVTFDEVTRRTRLSLGGSSPVEDASSVSVTPNPARSRQ